MTTKRKTSNSRGVNLSITSTRVPSFPAFAQLFLTTFQSTFDRFDQFRVVKRLRQKIDGALLHRPSGGRHVAMAGNEDNLLARASCFERFLQPQTIQSRHPNIENKADRAFEDLSREIIFG